MKSDGICDTFELKDMLDLEHVITDSGCYYRCIQGLLVFSAILCLKNPTHKNQSKILSPSGTGVLSL